MNREMRAVKTTPPQEVADLRLGPNVQYAELPIICVKATYNNTIMTLTDHLGVVLVSATGGQAGFKGAKRGTNYAGEAAGLLLSQKAGKLGYKNFRIRAKLNGLGPGRQSSLKGLELGGFEIVSITDVTPVPFNGP